MIEDCDIQTIREFCCDAMADSVSALRERVRELEGIAGTARRPVKGTAMTKYLYRVDIHSDEQLARDVPIAVMRGVASDYQEAAENALALAKKQVYANKSSNLRVASVVCLGPKEF